MHEEVVELRRKNQLTWPLAREMRVHEGMRLVIVYDPDTDEATVRPIRDSYAGALRGLYGESDPDAAAYVEGERTGWD